MNKFFELKNKTIFLTGATGYIGKKILQSLHNEGCKLILLLKDKKSTNKIKQFLNSKGRYGIPFNIVYGPNATNGIQLGELLTDVSVLAAINKAMTGR